MQSLGFRRDGDACTVINALANATFSGDDYQCKASFTEYDSGLCVAVVTPANAQVRGDRWTCNLGYDRTESDSYRRINLPGFAIILSVLQRYEGHPDT